eukprot:CAMPEP_0178411020 /NCGR_PEP_ID=MMETSP0689_2-20121128/21281_1 /TAXON_ID=160604 /ORGANISM="Amphidinium massartii, Strain CS-259" /LENGTH=296 /DNA_ID=CAMNT_0020032217 /DNA_START=87 /DNA_END=974 /DNA_ORIENTATION=-
MAPLVLLPRLFLAILTVLGTHNIAFAVGEENDELDEVTAGSNLRGSVEEADDEEPMADIDDRVEEDVFTPDQTKALYQLMDKDSDGTITLDEAFKVSEEMRLQVAKREVAAFMEDMDTNKDGKISLTEILRDVTQSDDEEFNSDVIAKYKALETKKFNAADQDHDGELDASELPAMFHPGAYGPVVELEAKDTMQGKDQDGDGELTAEEFWDGDKVDDEDIPVSDEDMADFQKLDKDHSGKLSLSELKDWESGKFHAEEALKELFRVADKNHDSRLSLAELEEAREAIADTEAQYH